ncbi:MULTISPECIES: helix-turn-helix domain-containing protein [Aliarcobacter]|uniref:helix-turn-helix domain-containing protein n=1 Tax=Aliarcobacter TaxID=2321111 RepID=UPI000479DFB6|nr:MULTISPECIES: helix-turn-helix domain-containing protein [Aliarcobacter]MBF7065394.1 helix-turn-helix domain-containing protein [Aliarcobacter butzleri]
MNFESFFDKLLSFYKVKTVTDLADKLNVTRSTVQGWKNRQAIGTVLEFLFINEPSALIYIFNSNSNIQMNNGVSGGQIAQTVKGNLITNNQIIDDIDNSTLSLFKEAYYKAKESDDIKGFRIYLMEYK